jgi:hypothetical protein
MRNLWGIAIPLMKFAEFFQASLDAIDARLNVG